MKPKRSKTRLGMAGVLAGLCIALLLLAPLSALNLWESPLAPAGVEVKTVVADPEKQALKTSERLIKESEVREKTGEKAFYGSLKAPDLKAEVASIKKQIAAMKKSGASEKDIQAFSTDAKKKLAMLEKKFKKAQATQEAKAKAEASNAQKQTDKARDG